MCTQYEEALQTLYTHFLFFLCLRLRGCTQSDTTRSDLHTPIYTTHVKYALIILEPNSLQKVLGKSGMKLEGGGKNMTCDHDIWY